VANPSARHQCSVQAPLKPAGVPNLFCGSYRKGSGLDFLLILTCHPARGRLPADEGPAIAVLPVASFIK
jgi:hypothetical protein